MSTMNFSLTNYEMLNYKNLYTVITPIPGIHLMPHMHWHPQYELMLVQHGDYALINNRTEIRRNGRGIFIHCPYSLHNMNTVTKKPYERDLIYIERHLINSFCQQFLNPTAFASASLLYAEPTEEELHEMRSLAHKAAACGHDRITGALYIAILLRQILAVIDSGRGETIRTEFSYIQDVLRHISENLADDHSLQSIAEIYSVSVSKLQRDFASATGSTFHRYLSTLRQTHAREMLISGESIIKATLECGYCNESHFIKAFREYWGITPGTLLKSEQS